MNAVIHFVYVIYLRDKFNRLVKVFNGMNGASVGAENSLVPTVN